jgi:hypothetical protein
MDNSIDYAALDALMAQTQEVVRGLTETVQKSRELQEWSRTLRGSWKKGSLQVRSSLPAPSDPSPAEIAARCAAIRAGLSEKELQERLRADWRLQSWHVPHAHAADLPGVFPDEDR